jgi:hypothetical protein
MLCEESLAISRELRNKQSMAISLNQLGHLERSRGAAVRARTLHAESLMLCRELGDRRGIAECLEGLAVVELEDRMRLGEVQEGTIEADTPRHRPPTAGGTPDLVRAARLFGAAEALRLSIDAPRPPIDRTGHDLSVAALRGGLGDDAFAAAWAEGRAMSLEQAMCVALEECEVPTTGGKDS